MLTRPPLLCWVAAMYARHLPIYTGAAVAASEPLPMSSPLGPSFSHRLCCISAPRPCELHATRTAAAAPATMPGLLLPLLLKNERQVEPRVIIVAAEVVQQRQLQQGVSGSGSSSSNAVAVTVQQQ